MRNYGVRSVVQHGESLYEERIVLVAAADEDEAFELAAAEARRYCEDLTDCRTLDFYQSYAMEDGAVGPGAEIFSLMRGSELNPDDYLTRFFDTGEELERSGDDDDDD